jgi:phytoene dehydrogenase-like protein
MKTDLFNTHKIVLEKISRRSPGIEKHLEIVVTASPSTIKRYTKNLNGSAYGWASTLSQSGESRGSFSTQIPGLYQAGHWTQPGSGVPGVTLSGIQVSSHVLELIN